MHWYDDVLLPSKGQQSRYELLRWLAVEQDYVTKKFGDETTHTAAMQRHEFPHRQVCQYLDRAQEFLAGAAMTDRIVDQRLLEAKAQQAIGKAIMTLLDVGSAGIEAYGPMPQPGHPTGEIVL